MAHQEENEVLFQQYFNELHQFVIEEEHKYTCKKVDKFLRKMEIEEELEIAFQDLESKSQAKYSPIELIDIMEVCDFQSQDELDVYYSMIDGVY